MLKNIISMIFGASSRWSKPIQVDNFKVRMHISSNFDVVRPNKEDLQKLIQEQGKQWKTSQLD